MLRIGPICAKEGERQSGYVTVCDGTGICVQIPVVLICGRRAGPTLWVNAGIHGAEYPGIEAAMRIARDVSPEDLSGSLIILPIVNLSGYYSRSTYVHPPDGKNLNRVFPGDPDGSISEVIAHFLMTQVAPSASYFVDLHGGDLIESLEPFVAIRQTGQPSVDEDALGLAAHYGIPKLVKIGPESTGWTGAGTLFASIAVAGIPSLLAEAGGCGLLDEPSTQILYDGVINLLHFLRLLSGPIRPPVETKVFDDFIWLYAKNTGAFYPDVKPGDSVSSGDVVGRVKDTFGAEAESVVSPIEGEVLFLVTSPAIKKNGIVMGIGKELAHNR